MQPLKLREVKLGHCSSIAKILLVVICVSLKSRESSLVPFGMLSEVSSGQKVAKLRQVKLVHCSSMSEIFSHLISEPCKLREVKLGHCWIIAKIVSEESLTQRDKSREVNLLPSVMVSEVSLVR